MDSQNSRIFPRKMPLATLNTYLTQNWRTAAAVCQWRAVVAGIHYGYSRRFHQISSLNETRKFSFALLSVPHQLWYFVFKIVIVIKTSIFLRSGLYPAILILSINVTFYTKFFWLVKNPIWSSFIKFHPFWTNLIKNKK